MNERTSKRVAEIAGYMLRMLDGLVDDTLFVKSRDGDIHVVLSVRDLRSLAASALTQAPNKPIPQRRVTVRPAKKGGK